MPQRPVSVFFYGSYMNRAVLAEVDLAPTTWAAAQLPGFDIVIAPRANVVRSGSDVVHGVLTELTHDELARLYGHAESVLGERYLPEAVIVHDAAGHAVSALCYVAHDMAPRPAAADYVERIVRPATEVGFPAWYVARLAAFGPRAGA